jgi:hypothetical protein
MIASTNWRTLPKLPGRIACWLKSRKKRSTRFIQDEPVGVKCSSKRGWRASQRLIAGCLVRGGVIVQNDVDVLAQRNFDLSSIVSAGLYPSNHHAESAAIKIDLWGQPEGFLKVTSAQHQQLHELQVRKCERRVKRRLSSFLKLWHPKGRTLRILRLCGKSSRSQATS